MTKPTALENTIRAITEQLNAATADLTDLQTQFAQLDREQYKARVRVAALTDALTMLQADHPAAAPAPATPRQKPGAVEAAITDVLAKYPDGVKLDGLVDRTGMNRGSVQAALKRMIAVGNVLVDGDFYRDGALRDGQDDGQRAAAE